jgi:PHD/YefM family antitoxin component YafN of YafNO toxin-antitoxin module
MPQIIPIRTLKNTGEVSQLCHNSSEPVFITKNGYGDMVIMSMDTYQRDLAIADIYRKMTIAEKQIQAGEVVDARASLAKLRSKYGKQV